MLILLKDSGAGTLRPPRGALGQSGPHQCWMSPRCLRAPR